MRRNGKQKEQKEKMNCDEEQVNYRVRQLPCLGSVPEQDHKLCKDSGKKKLLNVRRHKNRTFFIATILKICISVHAVLCSSENQPQEKHNRTNHILFP